MANNKKLLKEIRKEYHDFLNTEKGKEWKERWEKNNKDSERTILGTFGDYIYDFYPEMLQ